MRLRYLISTFATFALGLFVRIALWQYLPYCINVWIGDFIWAIMLYFACATVFTKQTITWRICVMIVFCITIECSQMWHTDWLDAFRSTTLGGLLLGHGFLWSDIAADIVGIFCGGALDKHAFSIKREVHF
jgi:type IV secretory pathway TraG/TraD family ATPase VirD4